MSGPDREDQGDVLSRRPSKALSSLDTTEFVASLATAVLAAASFVAIWVPSFSSHRAAVRSDAHAYLIEGLVLAAILAASALSRRRTLVGFVALMVGFAGPWGGNLIGAVIVTGLAAWLLFKAFRISRSQAKGGTARETKGGTAREAQGGTARKGTTSTAGSGITKGLTARGAAIRDRAARSLPTKGAQGKGEGTGPTTAAGAGSGRGGAARAFGRRRESDATKGRHPEASKRYTPPAGRGRSKRYGTQARQKQGRADGTQARQRQG